MAKATSSKKKIAPPAPGLSYGRGGPGPVQPPQAFIDENTEAGQKELERLGLSEDQRRAAAEAESGE